MGSRFSSTVAVTVAVLLLFEVCVRIAAPSLPAPLLWSSEEEQAKVVRMTALARTRQPFTVFVGSSVSDFGIDPTLLAPSSYNASIRGASMQMIDLWTVRVVVPTLRPTTVVIGLSSRELTPNDSEQQVASRNFLAAPAVRRLLGRETTVDKASRWLSDASALYKYRTVLRQPLEVLGVRKTLDSGVVLTPSGRDASATTAVYDNAPGILDFLRTGPLAGWQVGAAESATLRRLIDGLRRAGVGVVLVDMPVTADYVSVLTAVKYRAAAAAMAQAASTTGTRFVEEGVWPSSFFADPLHLNGAGADRLSRLLATQLAGELSARPGR